MSRDALVVGINHYTKSPELCLASPVQDARAIADCLAQRGQFRVTRMLATDAQHPVNHQALSTALKQLFKPDSQQVPDTALFYFSGHGFEVDDLVKEVCLATSDTGLSTSGAGIRLKALRELLITSPVKQQLVWLDCCHSGAILNFQAGNPGNEGQVRDRCFIAASREFEVAYGGRGKNYSVLTQALLKGLQQPGLDNLNSTDLISFLRRDLAGAPQTLMFHESGGGIDLIRHATTPTPNTPAPTPHHCPYKGLEFFTEADAPDFAGRQALTDKLVQKVREDQFLALVGASGSGKSSVLRAGLLKALRQGSRLSGSDQWQICGPIAPGDEPFESLVSALVDLDATPEQQATQKGEIRTGLQSADPARWLADWVEAQVAPQVVLVLDQFEEIFTGLGEPGQAGYKQRKADQRAFLACVLGALAQTQRLKAIVAMRADFLGKCLEEDYSGLAGAIEQHLVPVLPLTPEELTAAICEPAQRVALEVDPLLVKALVADVVKAPGSLPLLQFTLKELWQAREENQLTLTAYQESDGLIGTLNRQATAVYEQFDEDEQRTVRHIFQQLTQLSKGVEDTRRRVIQQDLTAEPKYSAAQIQKVVNALSNSQNRLLVTTNSPDYSVVIDVAHESLIRHWRLLQQWIDEDRDLIREKRKIEDSAEVWFANDKDSGYLIPVSRCLEVKKIYEDCLQRNLYLNHKVTSFLHKSLKRRARRRNVKLLIFMFFSVLFLGIGESDYRNRKIKYNFDNLESSDGKEVRDSINYLVRGCESHEKYKGIFPLYIDRRLFGNCHSLNRIVLLGVQLENLSLINADLAEADLRGSNFTNSNLRGVRLIRADMRGVKLNNSDLGDSNLSEADLSGADLRNVSLNGSDLRNAQLTGTDLMGANLEQAIHLSKESIESSLICHTKLPQSFDIESNRDCGFMEFK